VDRQTPIPSPGDAREALLHPFATRHVAAIGQHHKMVDRTDFADGVDVGGDGTRP
jgi:hypothetical protein